MSVDDYLNQIGAMWPSDGQPASQEMVSICVAAVSDFPDSAVLWRTLGWVMQLCDEQWGFSPKDYLYCMEKAIACDPKDAESHQERGYVLDVYCDDYEQAKQAFDTAIALDPSSSESYYGRARVLAELHRVDEAVASLSESECPYCNDPGIAGLRSEIVAGLWSCIPTMK